MFDDNHTVTDPRKDLEKLRFMDVTKTFKQMMETPRVDCMIMTRETLDSIKKYIKITGEVLEFGEMKLTGITIYVHQWLGDLIVYGDSTNKVIRRIIETCENRKDVNGIKIREVIR